jgi:hypothetical protein
VNFAAGLLMLFPAFLLGCAFGILLALVLSGPAGLQNVRPIVFSVAGSAVGVLLYLLTADWWPPVTGPFVLCPALSATAALAGLRKPQ